MCWKITFPQSRPGHNNTFYSMLSVKRICLHLGFLQKPKEEWGKEWWKFLYCHALTIQTIEGGDLNLCIAGITKNPECLGTTTTTHLSTQPHLTSFRSNSLVSHARCWTFKTLCITHKAINGKDPAFIQVKPKNIHQRLLSKSAP